MPEVSVLKTEDYALTTMRRAVGEHFVLHRVRERLRPEMKVVLKPNLLMKRTPEEATTTHPALVEAVILELQALGVTHITLADSPGGLYNRQAVEAVYKASGLWEVARRTGARLNEDFTFQALPCPQGEQCREFNIITPLAQADFIINLPKLKTHGMTTMTGGVKNLFGSVPGLQKPELHMRFPRVEEFCNMLVDLSQLVAPGFTIVDGVWGMEGDGPSGGSPRFLGVTLASADLYALDRMQCAMMGFSPEQVATVAHAIRRGLCPTGLEEITLLGEGFQVFEDLKAPKGKSVDFLDHLPGFLHRPLVSLRDGVLAPKPVIRRKDCVGCGRCAESCPARTITLENRRAVIHRGDCIRCFCCHEMCPVKAIDIRRLTLFDH